MAACTTSSVIPQWVTIAFGIIYTAALLFQLIRACKALIEDRKLSKKSSGSAIAFLIKDTWRRKQIYLEVLPHIFDQCTDIGVAIEFYQISQKVSSVDCGELNMTAMFYTAIGILIFYRILSAIFIYSISSNIYSFIYQFFDLELFRAIFVNYKLNNTKPSNPQRWIMLMEATFESSPQFVLQLVFIVKTGYNISYLVQFSLIWSILSVVMRNIADDALIRSQTNINIFMLTIWRWFDVSVHLMLLSFLWIYFNGYIMVYVILFDLLIIIICMIWTKNPSLIHGLVRMEVFIVFGIYRLTENVVIVIAIWIHHTVNNVIHGVFPSILVFYAGIGIFYVFISSLIIGHQIGIIKIESSFSADQQQLLDAIIKMCVCQRFNQVQAEISARTLPIKSLAQMNVHTFNTLACLGDVQGFMELEAYSNKKKDWRKYCYLYKEFADKVFMTDKYEDRITLESMKDKYPKWDGYQQYQYRTNPSVANMDIDDKNDSDSDENNDGSMPECICLAIFALCGCAECCTKEYWKDDACYKCWKSQCEKCC